MTRIEDPEVRLLASHASTLRPEYARDESWIGSPFEWILSVTSRQKGAVGEKMVSGYLATKGFDVVRSPDHEADRVINGVRAEIKMSTLWRNGGYKFQQLRDQDYAFAICLGLSPFDAHCWVIPKKVIIDGRGILDGLVPQHGGAQGRDTAWLSINLGQVPSWLAEHGGRLDRACEIVESLTGKKRLK